MLQPAPYVPPTPASWHYQLALPVTFLHAPFLFLLHQSGIHYLHTFALSTISVHLSVISNHTRSSQLSLPSHSVPAHLIRSLRFWRSINLVVCMYVCMYVCMSVCNQVHTTIQDNNSFPIHYMQFGQFRCTTAVS